jgi:DNA-binding transcriptional MerR regulator
MEFTIKVIADLVGLSTRTLRHYEGVGLLSAPKRTHGNYRLYSAEDVVTLLRIKRLTGLGLSLSEAKEVLDDPASAKSIDLLRQVDAKFEAQIEEATAKRKTIAEVLRSGGPIDVLPDFAERLAAQRQVQPDDSTAEMDRLLVDLVTGLGGPEEVERLRVKLDIARTQAELPEFKVLAELDRQLMSLENDAAAERIEELTAAYVEALIQVAHHVPPRSDPSGGPVDGLKQALVADRFNDAQVTVMKDAQARLNERLGR